MIIEIDDHAIPLEVKYQSQNVQTRDIPGLIDFLKQKNSVSQGYIITKNPNDVGVLQEISSQKKLMKIPACLFCYWIGASAFNQKSILT